MKVVTLRTIQFKLLGFEVCTLEHLLEDIDLTKWIALDLETAGYAFHENVHCVTLFDDTEEIYVIDTQSYPVKQLAFLNDCNVIIQNAKFDLRFLYHHGIVPKRVYDTLLAEKVLSMGKYTKNDYASLVMRHTGQQIDKFLQKSIAETGIETASAVQYAADDVLYLHAIKEKQQGIAQTNRLTEAVELDNYFVKVLAYTEFCGIKLDTKRWGARVEKLKTKHATLKEELDSYIRINHPENVDPQLDLFGGPLKVSLNYNSVKQMLAFFNDLGVNTTIFKKGEEKQSVDVEVLSKQQDISPFIPIYLKYKKTEKELSTWGDNWYNHIDPKTGRIHTIFQQLMNTGRMSCGARAQRGFHGDMPNLQNLPRDPAVRACFVPEKGHVLNIADYSNQEGVIFGELTNDTALVAFYRSGESDIHSYVAREIWRDELGKLTLKEIKDKHPELRQQAKSANFAIQFGGNGFTIASNLGADVEVGERVYDGYMKAFPGIKNYFDAQEKGILKRGYILVNEVTHRKRYLPNFSIYNDLLLRSKKSRLDSTEYRKMKRMESSMFKEGYNTPVQGTAADMTKYAGVLFFNWIMEQGLFGTVKITNIIHDEYVVERPNELEEVGPELSRCMGEAGRKFLFKLSVKAEFQTADEWKK